MTRLFMVACAGVALSACTFGPYVIERTLGGERREGPFVPPYAYEHYVRAELAIASERWAEAADELAMARSGGDDDPLLCARHAVALGHAGDAAGARRALEEGFALDAASEAVHLAAAELAQLSGDLSRALEHAELAFTAAPQSRVAALALADLLDRTGDVEAAARVLARTGSGPTLVRMEAALRVGDLGRMMALARRTALDRGDRVRFAGRLVGEHPVLAAELIAPLSGEAPRDEVERRLRIDVAVAMNERADAERLLAGPRADDPPQALADAGALLRLGRAGEAALLLEALREEASSTDVDLLLAEAWAAEGRIGEAAALLAAVPAGSSRAAQARALVADVLARGGLPELGVEVSAE